MNEKISSGKLLNFDTEVDPSKKRRIYCTFDKVVYTPSRGLFYDYRLSNNVFIADQYKFESTGYDTAIMKIIQSRTIVTFNFFY